MTDINLPNNIGRTRTIEELDGNPVTFTVVDEIIQKESGWDGKLLSLQRLKFENSYMLRLGYYMLTKRANTGKEYWAWGQYCTMIALEDWESLNEEAKRRNWFSQHESLPRLAVR
jgi:hypothetical protein